MDRLYANRLSAETASVLAINLYNLPLDHAKARDPAAYRVTSPDDPDFGDAGVQPAAAGGRTRTERAPIRTRNLVKGTHLFLQLPRPMKNGKHYAVRVAGDLGAKLPPLDPLLFDDRRQINDVIRVNQLGYLTGFPKRAYVGQYLGDLGPMAIDATQFELLDTDGRAAFKGQIARREVGEEYVGQRVYELDFSAFETPGTYRLFVPGVGVSYRFDVGPRALAPLHANLMRGNFQQRCGREVTAEFSRHAKVACHLDDAVWDSLAAEKTKFVAPKRPPLYPGPANGARHATTHGHHDAGDYGKYTSTGASYVFSLLQAMEVFPDKLREDALGLPTSGDEIPDLLQEVKWELDWLENMQDEGDGGVSGVIRPKNGGYEQFLPPAQGGRLMFPKDTVFTAAYAGALAHAARSPVMREHYPRDCARYLSRALAAWAFLEKNSRYVEYFHYGAVFGDWDERCWAACELYAATGDAKFHDYFLKQFEPGRKRWDWWPMFEAVGYATQAYLFLPADRPRDAKMLARCEAVVKAACEQYVADAANHPYRLSMSSDQLKKGQYGWFFPADMTGYDLLIGYARTKDRRYVECALSQEDFTCGVNPHGYFLQTGLGAKRNIEAVNQQSWYDDVIEPVPGIPLGIGTPGFYYIADYGKALGAGEYPPTWPAHNRWYDGFNVSSEVTMGPWARETVVAGFFAGQAPPAGDRRRPTVKITADRLAGVAPLRVQFNLRTTGRRVREVFWDFDDESFSTLASPSHVFAGEGRHYRVAATVVDEDGLSAYDEVAVDALLAWPEFPREPARPDAKTVALFHLDGDLADAGRRHLELRPRVGLPTERPAMSFANAPPAWMAKPAGSFAQLNGAEQLVAELPAAGFKPDQPWAVEMMLYLKDFAGWSYPGNPILLGIEVDNDAWVGWRQDTWEKARLPRFATAGGATAVAADRFKDFPRDRWCHVRVALDADGAATLSVDGHEYARITGVKLKGNKPARLTIGPFRGGVDEVRLSQ